MKLLLICGATAVLAGVGAHAAESSPGLAVCVQHWELVNGFVMARAQALVTSIFSEAGVRIEWQSSRQCRNTASNVLRVEMDSVVPARFGPETMAYALPYGASGTAIHVFYDRVLQEHRELGAQVLGHVMAHEIGHVIEGIARHSPDGLMKARWDIRDYSIMRKGSLPFAAQDVELMQLSLRSVSAAAR
jgi:hypothetical protein